MRTASYQDLSAQPRLARVVMIDDDLDNVTEQTENGIRVPRSKTLEIRRPNAPSSYSVP